LNNLRLVVFFLVLSILFSCASNQNNEYITSDSISVSEFSSSVELLVSNTNFLEDEILKINAKNPSVQRILVNSDVYLREGKLIQANSELERALRITKKEGAIYLRLAHLRHIQGLLAESKSFASRALLIKDISSWERLLLNVYLKRPI
jgi:tetratricopeptide (TPR) repeat protein|tara:strand:+ start:3507 stop:3953 length:447 start_codon:yes stop_codon:yes gene_type:complete